MESNLKGPSPKLKVFKSLINNSYSFYSFNKSFAFFKSINNILFIIYPTKINSLISYNLITNQKVNEIKNAHKEYISNIHHCLDKNYNQDLIMSVSSDDNNIKLWKFKDFSCLYNFENVNSTGYLYSSCFLNDNTNIYIMTCNCSWKGISETIKIYDIKGNKIKKINNSKDKTFYIDVYYDIRSNKKYILTGNKGCVKSYNFNSNDIYKIYCDNDNKEHDLVMIYDFDCDIQLIDSCEDGFIRMWNFHSGSFIKKIKISEDVYGICLWNKYLLVGCEKKKIKIVDLENRVLIKDCFGGEDGVVIDMKKINFSPYGDCLVTQNKEKGEIKLWINEN